MTKKANLYLISGTGNTFRTACWIKDQISQNGIETDMDMIDEVDPSSQISTNKDQLVGILFPTHGFMPPWSMIKFLFRFPRNKGVGAFCMATRGSIFLGPLRIPGASGFATFMAGLILLLKGYNIRGLFSVDMASNFINIHWGLHPKNIEKIEKKTKPRLEKNIITILAGKKVFFTLNNLWELGWTVLLLWLVPIFPIIYLIFGKLFMAKMMFSNNQCIGCGLCAKSCPNEGIEMVKVGKVKRPYWTYHCENCMRCMGYCNKKAVEAGHSWGIALAYLTSFQLVLMLSAWLHLNIDFLPTVKGYWTRQLLTAFYFVPMTLIVYRVFWYLIRIKPINTLFSFTTLTHFYRRFRQPETKLKHMVLLAKRNQKKKK